MRQQGAHLETYTVMVQATTSVYDGHEPIKRTMDVVATTTSGRSNNSTDNVPNFPNVLDTPAIVHALSGAVGSAISILMVYPLERIRVEMTSTTNNAEYNDSEEYQFQQPVQPSSSLSSTVSTASRRVRAACAQLGHLIGKDGDSEDKTEEKSHASCAGLSYELVSKASTAISLDSSRSQDQDECDTEELDAEDSEDKETEESSDEQEKKERCANDDAMSSPTLSDVSSRDSPPSIQDTDNMQIFENRQKKEHEEQHLPLYQSMTSDETRLTCNKPAVVGAETQASDSALRRRQATMWYCLRMLYRKKMLYQGAGSMVFTYAISTFVYFYAHQALKKRLGLLNPSDKKPTWRRALLASSLAGIVNVCITNPFWVVYLRTIQAKRENKSDSSPFAVLRNILKTEGIPQLWKGTMISILLVSNPVIQHFLYDFLKRKRLYSRPTNSVRSKISATEAFILGAIAKAVSTVATYPLQLAQMLIRMQEKGKKEGSDSEYGGILQCLTTLYGNGGAKALYSGMEAKVLQSTLASAFTFLTYEQLLGLVRRIYFTSLTN